MGKSVTLLVAVALLLHGCGGDVNVRPEPPPRCPEGQVGTPPHCEEPPPLPPQTLNEQHRSDAGLDKIAPNGVWPSNHASIVKPKFAVVEMSSDRGHGILVQAAACIGYAPGGCEIEWTEDGDLAGVSNAPFTFITPRPGEGFGGVFQPHDLTPRLREHPHLRIAAVPSFPVYPDEVAAFSQEGIATVWAAGNEGTVRFRDSHPWLWDPEEHSIDNPDWDGVLNGDRLLAQIANDEVLFVAGYTKDKDGNFIPHESTTQCQGIDEGCIYGPMHFAYDWGDVEEQIVTSGTSVATPFVAAGLASVLAVFDETSGEDLIRLARACAVQEPGLSNGLGRFSLACMDNSEVFYLDRVDEESGESLSARAQGWAVAFARAPLPGDSTYVAEVEGVSLTRSVEGRFSHHSGILQVPQYQGVDEEDTNTRVNLFYDYEHKAPGIRAGNKDVFVALSWTNEDSFFGYGQYEAQSLNVSAGTEHLYLRLSDQKAETVGYGVIDEVEGRSVGATLTHTFNTSMGDITPFMNMDKFVGGEASTPFGSMKISGSEWNHEVGFRAQRNVSDHGDLEVVATVSHRGDLDQEDYGYGVQARYRLAF